MPSPLRFVPDTTKLWKDPASPIGFWATRILRLPVPAIYSSQISDLEPRPRTAKAVHPVALWKANIFLEGRGEGIGNRFCVWVFAEITARESKL
jgi:hypothetical protein